MGKTTSKPTGNHSLFTDVELMALKRSYDRYKTSGRIFSFSSMMFIQERIMTIYSKSTEISWDEFQHMVASFTKATTKEILINIIEIAAANEVLLETAKLVDAKDKLETIMEMMMKIICSNSNVTEANFKFISKSIEIKGAGSLFEWLRKSFPYLPKVFRSFIQNQLIEVNISTKQINSEAWGDVVHKSNILKLEHIVALTLTHEKIFSSSSNWNKLYSSDRDGLSFNRLCYHIENYNGPTLLLIRDNYDHIFGGFTISKWRESNTFYGDSYGFLFRLDPEFRIYHTVATTGRRTNYMYLNKSGYSLPHGLAMGGRFEVWRLYLDEDLEACKSSEGGLTYEKGPLSGASPMDTFIPVDIEVWGLGGSIALRCQAESREISEGIRQRMKKVDKAKLMQSDDKDGILFGKTFAHRQDIHGIEPDVKK